MNYELVHNLLIMNFYLIFHKKNQYLQYKYTRKVTY